MEQSISLVLGSYLVPNLEAALSTKMTHSYYTLRHS